MQHQRPGVPVAAEVKPVAAHVQFVPDRDLSLITIGQGLKSLAAFAVQSHDALPYDRREGILRSRPGDAGATDLPASRGASHSGVDDEAQTAAGLRISPPPRR